MTYGIVRARYPHIAYLQRHHISNCTPLTATQYRPFMHKLDSIAVALRFAESVLVSEECSMQWRRRSVIWRRLPDAYQMTVDLSIPVTEQIVHFRRGVAAISLGYDAYRCVTAASAATNYGINRHSLNDQDRTLFCVLTHRYIRY